MFNLSEFLSCGFLLRCNHSLNIFKPLAQDYTFFITKRPHVFIISARQIFLSDTSVGSPLLLLHLNSSSERSTVISDEKGLLKAKWPRSILSKQLLRLFFLDP